MSGNLLNNGHLDRKSPLLNGVHARMSTTLSLPRKLFSLNDDTHPYYLFHRDESLHAIIPPHQTHAVASATHALLCPAVLPANASKETPLVKWQSQSNSEDFSLVLHLPPRSGTTKQIVFHRRGDYVATVCEHHFFEHPKCVRSEHSYFSGWKGTDFGLDTQHIQTTFTKSFQKDKRHCTESALPSSQNLFYCGGKYFGYTPYPD
jgi:hypothetical protein